MPVLPDVLPQGLRLVICGTAPGTRSARESAYYAHPQNEFWKVLHRGGVTPHRMAPSDYPRLPEYGVGLTDMCKHVFGADSDLKRGDFDAAGLAARIIGAAPAMLAFNGKRAAQAFLGRTQIGYGLQSGATIGATRIYVVPSTSKLALRYWDEAIWMEMLRAAGFKPLSVADAEP